MLVTRPEGKYNALHMPPGAQAKIRKMGPMPNAQMCNLWDPIRRPSGPRAMLSLLFKKNNQRDIHTIPRGVGGFLCVTYVTCDKTLRALNS